MSQKRTKTYRSFSPKETADIGERMAREIRGKGSKRNGAAVLALHGDLGAGKTTFVGGFFKGLGLKKRAPSPTFVIMRRHKLRGGGFKDVFHVDAYRLKGAKALLVLGFDEVLDDPRNVVLVEWADRAKGILPEDALKLHFHHGKKENERTITMRKK